MRTRKVAVIFGTRPDTIKLAPIILALKRQRKYFRVVTIATAQHRQMLDQVLSVFRIRPDHDLDIMRPRQTLSTITRNTVSALDAVLAKEQPDLVLVQGDTTTTFVGSLAAFYRRIPVGHVEAGLRTNNRFHPFPEEINRRLTSCLADLHFAPTMTAKRALVSENIDPSTIAVTGNSVIDALRISVKPRYRFSRPLLRRVVGSGRRIVLITMHRRENWGKPMQAAATALLRLSQSYPECVFVFPVHLNPVVREAIYPVLHGRSNFHLTEPLQYSDFVNLMARSYLIITDSGGVQEEGPSLGKPVLVMREVTERPEAVAYGTVKLVGLKEESIFRSARRLLDDPREYRRMATAVNPYGDGRAAQRTVQLIKKYFGMSRAAVKEFDPKRSG